jgi:hypothetical protein
MLRTPQDEAKMIDEHLAYVNGVMAKRMEKRSVADNEVMRIQESKKRKEFDKSKMELQVRKVFGSKRYAREQLLDLDRTLNALNKKNPLRWKLLKNLTVQSDATRNWQRKSS